MRMVLLLIAAGAASAPSSAQPALPNPALQLATLERYTAGGGDWVRHSYQVLNRTAYPPELFAAAPELPPCGLNRNSSRSWIDIYSADGKRLYGFCAISKPDELEHIWFSTELGVAPPPSIYIVITDRKTGAKYQSNVAPTAFDSAPPAAARP
jgi:hypothetical protein